MSTEEARRKLEDAHAVLRADYWADVRGVADDLKASLEAGEFASRDHFIQALDDTVDGHQRVIYTFEAQQCLLYSENDGAFIEEFGADGAVKDGCLNWSGLAYMAFRADIIEHLDALGVDVNDPLPGSDDE